MKKISASQVPTKRSGPKEAPIVAAARNLKRGEALLCDEHSVKSGGNCGYFNLRFSALRINARAIVPQGRLYIVSTLGETGQK